MCNSGENYTFEPLREQHAEQLFESFQDDAIYQFIPQRAPESLEEMTRSVRQLAICEPDEDIANAYNWVIRDNLTSVCVGTLQATIFRDGLLWIGYMLAQDYWGRGIATLAVSWVVASLRVQHPSLPIHAAVDTRNRASIRVLEKTGFTLLRRETAEIRGVATEDYIYQI